MQRERPPLFAAVALWSVAGLFLVLSGWLVPGSIWGTSDNSPYADFVFLLSIPVLVIALVLLILAIWVQRLRRA
jgi:hypothetical protein